MYPYLTPWVGMGRRAELRISRTGNYTRIFNRRYCARATVKKFMVGYEMLGEAQRDLTAELAAQPFSTSRKFT